MSWHENRFDSSLAAAAAAAHLLAATWATGNGPTRKLMSADCFSATD